MQISRHKIVSIDYTLTDEQGRVLDSSQGRDPLTYLHGVGGIVPGLEQALEGKAAGAQVQVSIPPEQAYGQKNPQMVQTLPREAFKGVDKVEPGMQFQAQSDGGARIVTVVDVEGDNVRIDANHPLAGVTLNFDVTVAGVRDATPEELTHGHAHGPGSHAH